MSRPRRALVVDDDRGMVRTLSDILRLSGWEVDTASSGEEAIEKVVEEPFTAVLMDVRMGGISGVEALREVRRRRPMLPVILMTAYATAATIADASSSGATRVLPKPLAIPDLLQLLDRAEESRRSMLIIDDDPAFLRSLADLLRAREFDVRTATLLDEALVQLALHPTGVILLDLKLDDLDPRMVLDAVRRASPSAALVLFSENPQLMDATPRDAGGNRVIGRLGKPFSLDELTRMLDGSSS